jgi:hypothetical protein
VRQSLFVVRGICSFFALVSWWTRGGWFSVLWLGFAYNNFDGRRMWLLLWVFDALGSSGLGLIDVWLRVGGMGSRWLRTGEEGCGLDGSDGSCFRVEGGCWFGRRRGAEGRKSSQRWWGCRIWDFVRRVLRREVWVCDGLMSRVIGFVNFTVVNGLWCGGKSG